MGLEIQDKAIGREGCEVFYRDNHIGNITSGSWSPSLGKAIALAYINIEYCVLNHDMNANN